MLAIAGFLCLWAFATREGTTLGKLMPGPVPVFKHLIETTYSKVGPEWITAGHSVGNMEQIMVGIMVIGVVGLAGKQMVNRIVGMRFI